jgi:hypothetical protein
MKPNKEESEKRYMELLEKRIAQLELQLEKTLVPGKDVRETNFFTPSQTDTRCHKSQKTDDDVKEVEKTTDAAKEAENKVGSAKVSRSRLTGSEPPSSVPCEHIRPQKGNPRRHASG